MTNNESLHNQQAESVNNKEFKINHEIKNNNQIHNFNDNQFQSESDRKKQTPLKSSSDYDFDFGNSSSKINQNQQDFVYNYNQDKPVQFYAEPTEIQSTGPRWKKTTTKQSDTIVSGTYTENTRPIKSNPHSDLDFDFSLHPSNNSDVILPKNKVLKLGGSKKLGEQVKNPAPTSSGMDKLDSYFGTSSQPKPPVHFNEDFI